jgi:RNA polymerase sigma factor (sigma-70 family)
MARILVVDDDPIIVEGIQMLLELHDLQAAGASCREDAEALIAGEFFPIILSDLRMREADDGFRVIESARRLSPRSRVATITAYADASTERMLRECGAHLVLRKPLSEGELMAAVRELLAVVEAAEPDHAGDDESLYTATVDRLQAIARGRYGFSVDEAAELIQETWLLFLTKRRSVREPRAWLAGTIANLCRQEIERRVRAREHASEVPLQTVTPADDEILAVRQALAAVDERSRTLCTLIGLEQRSYEEVSEAAGIPLGSVGPLYIRAKARLRQAMAA